MNCPLCEHGDSFVIRTTTSDDCISRIRQCKRCGNRWKTHEMAAGTVEKAREVLAAVRKLADSAL